MMESDEFNGIIKASEQGAQHLEDSKRYNELKDFIQNRMRMSHVYQPVMLTALLKQNGRGVV